MQRGSFFFSALRRYSQIVDGRCRNRIFGKFQKGGFAKMSTRRVLVFAFVFALLGASGLFADCMTCAYPGPPTCEPAHEGNRGWTGCQNPNPYTCDLSGTQCTGTGCNCGEVGCGPCQDSKCTGSFEWQLASATAVPALAPGDTWQLASVNPVARVQ